MVVKKYVKAKTNKMYGGSKRKTPKLKKSLAMRAVGWGTRTAALGARTKAFVNPKSSLKKLVPGGLDTAKEIKRILPDVSYRKQATSIAKITTSSNPNKKAFNIIGKLLKSQKLNPDQIKKKTEEIKNLLQPKVSVAARFAENLTKLAAPGANLKTVTTEFEKAKAALTGPAKLEAAPPKPAPEAAPSKTEAAPAKLEAPALKPAPAEPKPPAPAQAGKAPQKKQKTTKQESTKQKPTKQNTTKIKGATTTSSKTDSGPGILRTAKAVGKSIKKGASAVKTGVVKAYKGVQRAVKGVTKGAASITQVK